jgi:hypothetical protein
LCVFFLFLFVKNKAMFILNSCESYPINNKINIQVIPKEERKQIKYFRFSVNCVLKSGYEMRICIGLSKKPNLSLSKLKPHDPESVIFIDAISDIEFIIPSLPNDIEMIIMSYWWIFANI